MSARAWDRRRRNKRARARGYYVVGHDQRAVESVLTELSRLGTAIRATGAQEDMIRAWFGLPPRPWSAPWSTPDADVAGDLRRAGRIGGHEPTHLIFDELNDMEPTDA